MKKQTLMAACLICFCPTAPNELHAQGVPVIDVANITQSAAAWAKDAAAAIERLNTLRMQYNMLVSTYSAISHVTDISSLTSALGGVTRTYVPEASETLQILGSASRIFGSGGRHMSTDQLFSYSTAGSLRSAGQWFDRQSGEMLRRETVTSNAKALAESGMQDAQGRITELAAAQVRIGAARDVTEVAAVQAALTASQMNIDIHKAQIDNMRLALEAENRVERQRAEQMQVMGAAQWADSTQASVDSLGSGD